jgi:hypothetical protein
MSENLKSIKQEIREYFKDNLNFKGLNSYDNTYFSEIRVFLKQAGTINKFGEWLKSKEWYNQVKSVSQKEGRFKHNCAFLIKINVELEGLKFKTK